MEGDAARRFIFRRGSTTSSSSRRFRSGRRAFRPDADRAAVYVGAASPAVLQHIDVKGKSRCSYRPAGPHAVRARRRRFARGGLVKRGAIGVFNLVRLPGNELSRDFSDCGNPCFNIGGRDGLFLESILDRAAQAGIAGQDSRPHRIATQTYRSLKASNGVAIIRGLQTSDRAQCARGRMVRRRRRQRRRPRGPDRTGAAFRKAGRTSRSAPSRSWPAPDITLRASTVRAVS